MGRQSKPTVVLTGFGVFRDYTSNPSWEAVKLMKIDVADLIKIEIPVIYEVTQKEVDRIWAEYNPTLVVHCGVSHLASCLTLEKQAVKNLERYCSPDVTSCRPCGGTSDGVLEPCNANLQYLYTRIDLDQVCADVNELYGRGRTPIPACVSNRAGEYLCEYIYKCSLEKDAQRTLFVHVPKITEEVTVEDIARGLEATLECILSQLH